MLSIFYVSKNVFYKATKYMLEIVSPSSKWSSKEAWLKITTLVYSISLFSSLLKKRGKMKRRMNSEKRDFKSYLSALSINIYANQIPCRDEKRVIWKILIIKNDIFSLIARKLAFVDFTYLLMSRKRFLIFYFRLSFLF